MGFILHLLHMNDSLELHFYSVELLGASLLLRSFLHSRTDLIVVPTRLESIFGLLKVTSPMVLDVTYMKVYIV